MDPRCPTCNIPAGVFDIHPAKTLGVLDCFCRKCRNHFFVAYCPHCIGRGVVPLSDEVWTEGATK